VTAVVVNHLRLREPLPDGSFLDEAVRAVVDAGGLSAQVVKVDETHLILVLTFPTVEEAERIAREVGGPMMREHITPLLAAPTERSVGEVVATA
jgi:hypothetical protein